MDRTLTAKPTVVVHTQTTVDRHIDRLRLRAQLRAAALGLTLGMVAGRMGLRPNRLYKVISAGRITREMFARLAKALEGHAPGQTLEPWWEAPLPPTPHRISARKVREAIRRQIAVGNGND